MWHRVTLPSVVLSVLSLPPGRSCFCTCAANAAAMSSAQMWNPFQGQAARGVRTLPWALPLPVLGELDASSSNFKVLRSCQQSSLTPWAWLFPLPSLSNPWGSVIKMDLTSLSGQWKEWTGEWKGKVLLCWCGTTRSVPRKQSPLQLWWGAAPSPVGDQGVEGRLQPHRKPLLPVPRQHPSPLGLGQGPGGYSEKQGHVCCSVCWVCTLPFLLLNWLCSSRHLPWLRRDLRQEANPLTWWTVWAPQGQVRCPLVFRIPPRGHGMVYLSWMWTVALRGSWAARGIKRASFTLMKGWGLSR